MEEKVESLAEVQEKLEEKAKAQDAAQVAAQETEHVIDKPQDYEKVVKDDGTIVLDFTKKQKRTVAKSEAVEEVKEEIKEEVKEQVKQVIDNDIELVEINDEKIEVKQDVEENVKVDDDVPIDVSNLIKFLKEKGGSIEDYVKLNRDIDKVDEMELLKEYYSQTKSYYSGKDLDFYIEDNLKITDEDKETLTEKQLKRKELAYKEEVNKAKKYLKENKDNYYKDITVVPKENKEAVEFYSKYKKSQEDISLRAKEFKQESEKFFNTDFKGFDFNVGEKTYRFNVKNVDTVKNTQGNIENFVKKFFNEEGKFQDSKGYHKAFFTAMNADKIANHFYEQGRTDALKESVKTSKNIDVEPRKVHEGFNKTEGFRMVAVDNSGDSNSSKLRIKMNK